MGRWDKPANSIEKTQLPKPVTKLHPRPLTKGDAPEHGWQQHQGARVVCHRQHPPLSQAGLRHAGNARRKCTQRDCEGCQGGCLAECCRRQRTTRQAVCRISSVCFLGRTGVEGLWSHIYMGRRDWLSPAAGCGWRRPEALSLSVDCTADRQWSVTVVCARHSRMLSRTANSTTYRLAPHSLSKDEVRDTCGSRGTAGCLRSGQKVMPWRLLCLRRVTVGSCLLPCPLSPVGTSGIPTSTERMRATV